MEKKHIRILLTILTLLIFTLIQADPSPAKGPKKVAILPFTMHADRDLSFLQEGIMDMLASRLAWKGEVDILEKAKVKKTLAQIKGPVNREKALLIGNALKADHVILGSLTVFGESVSIDARILDVAKSEELMTAFKQSKGMDEVIPTVNQFAQDINEKIMGRVVARPPAYPTVPEEEMGPRSLVGVGGRYPEKDVGHVQNFRLEILAMDVGDVDGDGKNELVFIDKSKVYIYKWVNGTFAQLRTLKGGWSPNYVYVSVGDMDGNGRSEIYVSNASGSTLSSFVLEWQGNDFKKIAEGQSWFLRVIDIPGEGKKLIGQKRLTDGSFKGDVQFLSREGSRFVSTGPLKLPRFGNVFNFALADLAGEGKTLTIMLDPYEHLILYDHRGERIWRSEEYFGGSLAYLQDKEHKDHVRMDDTGKFIHISSPIFLTDIDEDGQREVVICSNHSITGRLLGAVRDFRSGKVHFMIWDKVGLSTKWTSRKLSGPVVGYNVRDVDDDGVSELVIAAVTKARHFDFVSKPRSRVVVYELK